MSATIAEAEVNISYELVESNDINIDLYKDYIYAAITKIRSSGKRPDTKPIFSYLVKNACTNINEDLLEKVLTSLTDQKKLENWPTTKGNSYFIIDDCVNQETESLLTVDSKSIFSPKPSYINTPTKSQTGDCCDPLMQENVSEAPERKSNDVEQPVSLRPFTTLFNRLFKEFISLRSYVSDELQHLREENRSKIDIIKLFSENITLGYNEMKEVLPHKENTFIEPSRKHSFKAN